MLESIADGVIFTIQDFYYFIREQFATRGLPEWLFFFMPFYVFGEFPRYMMPSIIMLVMKITGRLKDDTEQKIRFMTTHPSVSVLVVGRNEEATVENAIKSLLEIGYDGIEIIVIDDDSTDRMYEIAKPYADQGLIKLFKNTGVSGRVGKPAATNMALSLSKGEFVISVDSDTTFDRSTLLNMIGPFYDDSVGVVAGNLKVRNVGKSIWTDMQYIEYMISIGLRKRWLNVLGMNIQASGAFGAYRRTALEGVGGWDSELAEDADVSLKIKKGGWKIVFAPEAIAMTNVPETRKQLVQQRLRWDKGCLRTYFHKHGNIMKFWQFDWRNAFGLGIEYFFFVFLTFLYAAYIGFMLAYHPKILLFVWLFTYFVYMISAEINVATALVFSERRKREWSLIFTAILFPLHQGFFRWVRFGALVLEIFRVNYSDTYLPETAWRNTEKW